MILERRQNAGFLCRSRRSWDRAIMLASDDPTDLMEWALSVPNDELVATIKRADVRIEVRNAALDELLEREEPALVPVVVTMLGKDDRNDPFWRALLRATPRMKVTDESLRRTLADNLWDIAEQLKESRTEGDEDLLWTAIRRYATLRPQADIGKLVEFLDEPDTDERLPRFHVVLLAIQNAFYASPPNELEMASLQKLRGRVSALAHKYLDRAFLTTPDQRAIALSSYCAAAILGCADLVELTQQAISMREMWLLELAEQKLSPLAARWLAREDAAECEKIWDLLQDVTRQLLLAISSGTTV